MIRQIKVIFIGALLLPLLGASDSREAFCLMPLFSEMFQVSDGTNLLSDVVVQEQIDQLKIQIGSSRQYFETGFAGIFRDESNLARNFRMAYENNISLGAILSNNQTHSLPGTVKALLTADIRRYPWRQNGVDWYGINTTNDEGTTSEYRSGEYAFRLDQYRHLRRNRFRRD